MPFLKRIIARRESGEKGGVFNPDDLMLSLPQVTDTHERTRMSSSENKSMSRTKSTKHQHQKHIPNPHKSRNRAQLLAEEARQFSRVLKHPAFKQDASQAIHQHIINKMKQEQASIKYCKCDTVLSDLSALEALCTIIITVYCKARLLNWSSTNQIQVTHPIGSTFKS